MLINIHIHEKIQCKLQSDIKMGIISCIIDSVAMTSNAEWKYIEVIYQELCQLVHWKWKVKPLGNPPAVKLKPVSPKNV